MLLPFLLVVFAETEPFRGRVHVEGAYTATVARALQKELPFGRVEERAEDADFTVSLEEREGAISLAVKDTRGAVALTRTIDLEGGLVSALRMAVLLTRGALEPVASPPSPTATASAAAPAPARAILPERSWQLAAAVHMGLIGWKNPGFDYPPGAIGAGVHLRLDRLRGAILGEFVCCSRSTSDIDAGLKEVLLLAEGGYIVFERSYLDLGFFGSGGLDSLFGDVRARVPPFASPGTPSSVSAVGAFVGGGTLIEVHLVGRLDISIRLGLRLFLPERTIRLPSPFVTADAVDTGGVGVFLLMGPGVRIL